MPGLLTESLRDTPISLSPKRTIIGVVLGLGLCACVSQPANAQLDPETVRFVAEVLARNEYFEKREDDVCRKWATPATISTFGEGSHHPSVMGNVVRQINECLPDALKAKQVEANDESASIKIYFVPLAEFPKVAKKYAFATVPGNRGFFRIWWNEKYEIERAVVLIASDRLRGKRLHHMLLEEVTQVFGPSGDSKRFEDSVFYENMQQGQNGTARKLSTLDKKTIKFLYQHVPAGAYEIELGVLMAKHWPQ